MVQKSEHTAIIWSREEDADWTTALGGAMEFAQKDKVSRLEDGCLKNLCLQPPRSPAPEMTPVMLTPIGSCNVFSAYNDNGTTKMRHIPMTPDE